MSRNPHFSSAGTQDTALGIKGSFRPGFQKVVSDFGKLSRIGSTGIDKAMRLYEDLAMHGATLTTANSSSAEYDLLHMATLDTIVDITRS
jgi:hypothetical protein